MTGPERSPQGASVPVAVEERLRAIAERIVKAVIDEMNRTVRVAEGKDWSAVVIYKRQQATERVLSLLADASPPTPQRPGAVCPECGSDEHFAIPEPRPECVEYLRADRAEQVSALEVACHNLNREWCSALDRELRTRERFLALSEVAGRLLQAEHARQMSAGNLRHEGSALVNCAATICREVRDRLVPAADASPQGAPPPECRECLQHPDRQARQARLCLTCAEELFGADEGVAAPAAGSRQQRAADVVADWVRTWGPNNVLIINLDDLRDRIAAALAPALDEPQARTQPEFTLCRESGQQAVQGACPVHHGDACLEQFVPQARTQP